MIITTPPCLPSWTSGTSRSCPLRWEPPASARTCTQSGWSQASPGFEFLICKTFYFCFYMLKMSASLLQTVLMIESGHLSGFHERKRLTRYVSYGRSRHPATSPTPSLSKSFKSTNHPYLPRSIPVKMLFLLQLVFCQSQSNPFFAHISTLRTSRYI